jgi:hypothetical protein
MDRLKRPLIATRSHIMQTILQTLGFIVQLGAGFVMWGGWLCFSAWAHEHMGEDRQAKPDGFERAASLVLLALLCTTIAALA